MDKYLGIFYVLTPLTDLSCAHVLFHLAWEIARIEEPITKIISDWKYFCMRKLKSLALLLKKINERV